MIRADTFRADFVLNHITDCIKFISIMEKAVYRILVQGGFQKMEVQYKNASDDNGKSFV